MFEAIGELQRKRLCQYICITVNRNAQHWSEQFHQTRAIRGWC